MRSIHLENVRNVRGLAGIPASGGRHVADGLFYRGAALEGMSASDEKVLFGELGIRRIVDVRCGWERLAHLDPVVDGVENLHIPFFDKDIVGIEYTKKLPGTRRRGHDFACDSLDFYRSMANPLTVGQMKRGLDAVFESALQGQATYIHCTGGKDRAGILSLLVLHVLDADKDAILEDYLITNVSRDAHIKKTYQRFLYLCYDDEAFARQVTDAHRARKENIEAFYAGIEDSYGGIDAFIAGPLGIDDARRERIQEACTA